MNVSIDRLCGESDFQYKERLIVLKIEKLIDLDWQEIIDILSFDMSVDHFRKVAKGIYESYQQRLSSPPLPPPQSGLSQLEAKRIEIEKERYKLQATKLELSKSLRQESRFELFYENLRGCIDELPLPDFKAIPISTSDDIAEYVVTISDPHYGAKFSVFGNEYSTDICKKRFESLCSELQNFIITNRITKIKFLNLGDSLQGILRINDLILNEIPVVQATVQYSRLVAQFLNTLAEFVEIDYYHVPYSNHTQTRPLGSKANEMAKEDLEYVILNYISDLLINNPRVTVRTEFLSSDKPVILNIKGYDCIAMHGHEIKNKQNAIKDLEHYYRKLFSYAFFGHDHAFESGTCGAGMVENIKYIVAPSFVGTCPYAESLKKSSNPAALILKFTDKGQVGTEEILL